MGCMIKTIAPPCGYNLEGISKVYLVDVEDFLGFQFNGDDLYKNCLVTGIAKRDEFTELPAPSSAKYSSTLSNGIYAHSLETFIIGMSAETIAELHLATNRKYIVFFKDNNNKYFTFGYQNGATFTYASQTTESTGSLLTFTCSSTYPLFEVTAEAMASDDPLSFEFVPDFTANTYCING